MRSTNLSDQRLYPLPLPQMWLTRHARIVLVASIGGAILLSNLMSVVKQGEHDAHSASPHQSDQWESVSAR